jgi:NAD(P)-dependent dehydrogenase (short-subunit alcohol dehydrogenase family)
VTVELLDLGGKRALVTGGSRGVGAAVATALGAAGAHVLVGYRTNEAAARATLAALAAAGGTGELAPANLVHPDEARALGARATADGGLDVLVHAAALGSFKPLAELRPNQWQLTLDTDARGFLLVAQAVGSQMPAGGRIVALSSSGGQRVVPGYGAIGIAKAALEATVRGLAVELGPRGITVNAVAGGLVTASSIAGHPAYADFAATVLARTPLGRLARADDLVGAVLLLLSPRAGWITGQTLTADGGAGLLV